MKVDNWLHCKNMTFPYLANLIVLWESVVIKKIEHESLVECLSVGQVLELKRLVEEWIQSFSMNL